MSRMGCCQLVKLWGMLEIVVEQAEVGVGYGGGGGNS